MTQNNQGAPAPPVPQQDPSLEITITRKVPLAILFALLIQIAGGIWAISGFYYSQKEMQNQMSENITRFTTKMNELKSTIYTRNEALLQFDDIRQENHRQDQEIKEMRNKLYGRRNE